jgi:hypothetical protein
MPRAVLKARSQKGGDMTLDLMLLVKDLMEATPGRRTGA